MRSLRSTGAAARGRMVLILLLAVTGVLVGLIGMHALAGSAHAGHDAATAPAAAQVMVEDGMPRCGEATGCEELGLMAASCVLALLALALLLPLSPARLVLGFASASSLLVLVVVVLHRRHDRCCLSPTSRRRPRLVFRLA